MLSMQLIAVATVEDISGMHCTGPLQPAVIALAQSPDLLAIKLFAQSAQLIPIQKDAWTPLEPAQL